jgi:glycosyltransferase involved in cell wall biosynthesis
MRKSLQSKTKVAVVIPCFKVRRHVLSVISGCGPSVSRIYVIDDCCPDNSGNFVIDNCDDPRVKVIFNQINLGVGGAVVSGYRAAINDGMQVIVKIDGDGQMDPKFIPWFIAPIVNNKADYTKGNRFIDPESLAAMPAIRLLGNAVLSLFSKFSSGYYDIFDPTNGYTAIHANVARRLPLEKLSNRYFFESDILFRLNLLRAVVVDVPMDAIYGSEVSNLKVWKVIPEFSLKHAKNFIKRIFYNYYLRDMSVGSIMLPVGLILMFFGTVFGLFQWWHAAQQGTTTPTGTIMLAALPTLMGLQFALSFLANDISNVPRSPLHLTSDIPFER